jgi:hypothetical protein
MSRYSDDRRSALLQPGCNHGLPSEVQTNLQVNRDRRCDELAIELGYRIAASARNVVTIHVKAERRSSGRVAWLVQGEIG